MPNDEGFHSPTPVVSESKPVKVGVDPFIGDVRAVHTILLENGSFECRASNVSPKQGLAAVSLFTFSVSIL